MAITFHLNGEEVSVSGIAPTTTLLDWLRNTQGLHGTKEGCNEGDCGACTVMVTDQDGNKALNACILLMPQLHGKSLHTVEGVASPTGDLHPVQQAMIDHHGSQCGFCTPGFVMSMITAHTAGARDHDDQLAGNLCRCTGYAPIIRAAQAAQAAPVPQWITTQNTCAPALPAIAQRPQSSDELAALYTQHPKATLIAGATDVGLWVTKGLRDLPDVIFLDGCEELKNIAIAQDEIRFGAMVNMNRVRETLAPIYPSYADMIRRYASQQVRNAATIGGNIANGSPIGDNPPALIALGARLHLRKGNTRRDILLEDFFIDYGKQDRTDGEFIETIALPRGQETFRVYKLSKRFDQDISAVLGAFNIVVDQGYVKTARIAFGGMAAIPKRAKHVEAALIGAPWTAKTIAKAQAKFDADFAPLTDMRASAAYRLDTARALLARYVTDLAGDPTHVLEVYS